MFKNFYKLQTSEKVFTVLGLLFSVAAVVFAVLAIMQNFGVLTFSVEMLPVALLLLGIQNLLNTAKKWKKERKNAVLYLVTGVFVISCVVAVFWLRGAM